MTYLNKKYHPIKLKIDYIRDGSFTGQIMNDNFNNLYDNSVTNYNKNDILNAGLNISVKNIYQHKIYSPTITCSFMNKFNSTNPLQCPIYYEMKEKYQFNAKNLLHLIEFTHFKDEYGEKLACKYKDECKSYIRSETGNNNFEDQCHMKLYRHPPRTR
eukprot:234480_1